MITQIASILTHHDWREWYDPDLRRLLSLERPVRSPLIRSRLRDVDLSFMSVNRKCKNVKSSWPLTERIFDCHSFECVRWTSLPVERPRSRSDETCLGERLSDGDRRLSMDRDRLRGDGSLARRSFFLRSFSFMICSKAARGSSMMPVPILSATPMRVKYGNVNIIWKLIDESS